METISLMREGYQQICKIDKVYSFLKIPSTFKEHTATVNSFGTDSVIPIIEKNPMIYIYIYIYIYI